MERKFKGIDHWDNSTYEFTIKNVEFEKDYEDTGADAILCDIATAKGETNILEWVNNGKVERTDSNILINDKEKIENLFDWQDRPYGPEDTNIPVQAIFDALDSILLETRQ